MLIGHRIYVKQKSEFNIRSISLLVATCTSISILSNQSRSRLKRYLVYTQNSLDFLCMNGYACQIRTLYHPKAMNAQTNNNNNNKNVLQFKCVTRTISIIHILNLYMDLCGPIISTTT